MELNKKYLITSALPYANGELHLGHLAGAYLSADIFVRYLRNCGADVAYICGSDEHGAAITMRARKDGISPKEIVDKYHELNKETFRRLGISFDYYHRTSEALHHETSQAFFKKLIEKGGELVEQVTEQYYDEEARQFLADRYIIGECPKCANPEAYGDQCEKCGSSLSPTELVNPRSVLSGKAPVLRPTSHWYFQLPKHEAWLREWIEKGTLDGQPHHDPLEWKNHVTGQCLSWLDGGLQPRAITRDLDWGIPVPVAGAEGKVLYVWFDAPIGYISSTKQWALENGKNWEDYWKGDDVALYHFIGKDNIVFHCVIFPAMLRAHGEFALPINVPANQFLNFEGRKFSKSKNWGIEQHEYLEEFKDFPNKEDALRWALIRNMPENRDADFKWDEFVDAHDKDLADNLGNFINRVITLTNSYFGGKSPELSGPNSFTEEQGEEANVVESMETLISDLSKNIEGFNFKAAAAELMEIATLGNQFLQNTAPWHLRKANPDDPRIAECIAICLDFVTALSILCEPFIPFTSLRIRNLLKLPSVKAGDWERAFEQLWGEGERLLPAGHEVGKPEILFAKINDRNDRSRMAIVERQKAKLAGILAAEAAVGSGQSAVGSGQGGTPPAQDFNRGGAEDEATENTAPRHPELRPEIQYDDFAKLDIRTAVILAAERIPKADKLLKLEVDLGFEKRTVVSGIALHFSPEEIVGRRILLLANLAPRTMRGVVSQGMILMAEDGEGKLGFVSPEAGWGAGWTVK